MHSTIMLAPEPHHRILLASEPQVPREFASEPRDPQGIAREPHDLQGRYPLTPGFARLAPVAELQLEDRVLLSTGSPYPTRFFPLMYCISGKVFLLRRTQ